ncbi:MAG: endonuclease domain-containing protein [Sphingomonadales bacterium]
MDATERKRRQRAHAKDMRRAMTDAEKALWRMLRAKRLEAYKFRRQLPIGPYIVDFACASHRLIVEADGGQHAESAHDARRDGWLAAQGWRVLRFWNNEILTNSEGVWRAIAAALATPLPPTAARWAPPSPARGEGKDKVHG